MQIQAELGEGHDSIVNAKEAMLTEKHLAAVPRVRPAALLFLTCTC